MVPVHPVEKADKVDMRKLRLISGGLHIEAEAIWRYVFRENDPKTIIFSARIRRGVCVLCVLIYSILIFNFGTDFFFFTLSYFFFVKSVFTYLLCHPVLAAGESHLETLFL